MTQLRDQTRLLRPAIGRSAFAAAWPFAAAIALGVLMNIAVGPMVGGFATNVMLNIGIYIILAVSLTVVNGFTGQFSIGHAGFMAVGGYVTAGIVYYGSIRLWGTADFAGGAISYNGSQPFEGPLIGKGDVLFLAACMVGGLVAAAAGYLVGLPSLRLRGDYLAIVTLGFGEIVRVILQGSQDQIMPWQAAKVAQTPLYKLPVMLGGPKGFNLLPTYSTPFWVYMFVVLTLVFVYRLKVSSSGRAFLSIREDEIASQAMGVDITKNKVRAFVLSSFMAGVAGGLYAMLIGSINASDLGFQKSFDIIIMVVLGGMGSISGATLAAIILSILPEWLRDPTIIWPAGLLVLAVMGIRQFLRKQLRWKPLAIVAGTTTVLEVGRSLAPVYGINLADYRLIIYALMLILMMILRPQGLFGVNEIWEYFGERARTARRAKRGGPTPGGPTP